MIKLEQNTKTRGDCTAGYSVELTKEYTVKEFIQEVLKNPKEWGYIGIWKKSEIFGDPHCEFRHGKLTTKLPDDILDEKIVSVTASGGWSRMDYLLRL